MLETETLPLPVQHYHHHQQHRRPETKPLLSPFNPLPAIAGGPKRDASGGGDLARAQLPPAPPTLNAVHFHGGGGAAKGGGEAPSAPAPNMSRSLNFAELLEEMKAERRHRRHRRRSSGSVDKNNNKTDRRPEGRPDRPDDPQLIVVRVREWGARLLERRERDYAPIVVDRRELTLGKRPPNEDDKPKIKAFDDKDSGGGRTRRNNNGYQNNKATDLIELLDSIRLSSRPNRGKTKKKNYCF